MLSGQQLTRRSERWTWCNCAGRPPRSTGRGPVEVFPKKPSSTTGICSGLGLWESSWCTGDRAAGAAAGGRARGGRQRRRASRRPCVGGNGAGVGFSNRVDIWNPGGLSPQLTPDGLRHPHQSFARNARVREARLRARDLEKYTRAARRITSSPPNPTQTRHFRWAQQTQQNPDKPDAGCERQGRAAGRSVLA